MAGFSDLFQINKQDLTENAKMLPMLRTAVNPILITPQIHSSECFYLRLKEESVNKTFEDEEMAESNEIGENFVS